MSAMDTTSDPATGIVVTRPLFGGALQVNLPDTFEDVSGLRQVPDHQEVYVRADTDQSVIIELLDTATEASDDAAATYHFNNLATDNDAKASVVEHATTPVVLGNGMNGTLTTCYGIQTVAKFNEKADNQVRIFVACFRLADVKTDMVLSVNSPVAIAQDSSSAKVVTELITEESGKIIFDEATSTLVVLNKDLFVPS
eukprot:m.26416 g.26416  ORF g.26416 m.26416 type:complete len:198 (-) comp15398_c1_seq1:324-917(-)